MDTKAKFAVRMSFFNRVCVLEPHSLALYQVHIEFHVGFFAAFLSFSDHFSGLKMFQCSLKHSCVAKVGSIGTVDT